MARRRCAGRGRPQGERNRPGVREGVFPQGRQSRARAGRRGAPRERRPCRRLRARSQRCQADGSRSARKRTALSRDPGAARAREPGRGDGRAYGLDRPRGEPADRRDGLQRRGCVALSRPSSAEPGRGPQRA